MTLHELESASAVNDFKSSNANTLLCFSATWCGPCKAAKPQLEALASSYQQDPTVNVKFGIVYEHNLSEGIHEFGVRAFPTYILYVGNGSTQAGKIEGVDFDGIKKLIAQNGCKQDMGAGYSLGGNGGEVTAKPLSAAEARAQRLAKFEKKVAANPDPEPSTEQKDVMETGSDEDTPMEMETDAEASGDAGVAKVEEVKEDEDVEMKDADAEASPTETCTAVPEMVNPAADLSKELLETLTNAMGFSLLRAQKGLLNGSGGTVEGAVEWLMTHQDDADIDEPITLVPKGGEAKAQSYKCNECGKIFSNMTNLELHANKTGHLDFEESTQVIKPLTAEEKAAKVLEIKDLLKAKRKQREDEEKVDDVEKEKQRRSMGQQMNKTKEEMERTAMSRQAKQRKREKEAFKRERARIKAEIEKDKAERRAHKGRLKSKLGIEGYNPDAIQYDVDDGDGEEAQSPAPTKKKPKASVAKIDEYISKVAAYRAGGDGGKCLKVLFAYIKNIVEKPDDDKFRHIKMDNKVFKSKIKPFIGAKSLLLAVGFVANDNATVLDLDEHADREVLSQTKEKLEAALATY